ncbi:MAG: 16S rRNA pseudouridine(516) synthase [Oscillospiraceae bacterium]
MERLDKRLSAAGYSRKEAAVLIRAGRVKADSAVVTVPETKLPGAAVLTVDGVPLREGFLYIMLHKSAGVVTSTEDPWERTVLDLLPEELRRRGVFPVGRLDKDVTGLVLLTDDGPLGHRLTSPRHHVDKVYQVTVDGVLTKEDEAALTAGLVLGDGLRCLPARLERTGRGNVALLTLREGKYHQVKRMMACLGKPVTALKRLAMGPLTLDERLKPGEWRLLTEEEVAKLTKNA